MTISELQNASKIMIGSQEAECIYIGEELIWKNNKLPSNAVEIEYIESTGTQYIDLLFKPTTNKVTIQTNIAITNTSQDSTIIGTVDSETTLLRFYPLGFSNSKFYSCNFSGKWNSAYSLNSSNISSNVFYDVESTIGNTVSLIVNNNTYTQSRTEGYSGEKPLYLFARNESPAGHFAKCKMKYLKIYESDVLIIDLIPIRIGQIGYMYDKISKQIFENVGTGNFVLGPDKLPSEYTKLNYISSTSTGGQYIDLGCKLLQDTDDIQIDIKFNIKGEGKTSSGSDNRLSTLISSQPEVSPWPGFVLRRFSTANTNIHLQAKWQFTNSVARSNKYDSKYLSYGNNGTTNATTFGTLCEFSEILDNIPSSQINDTTCTLFCSFDASNNPFRFCEADLYYLRFKKGNTIIRNLIPAKRNSDNEIGLYDLQNNVFYISQGTESFVTETNLS